MDDIGVTTVELAKSVDCNNHHHKGKKEQLVVVGEGVDETGYRVVRSYFL